MSWAHAPVAGRRACRRTSPVAVTHIRMAPPRSAVTVSPSAPALARLTGFSRSGSPSPLGWLPLTGEAPVRSFDLALVLRLGVDNRWTTGVSSMSGLVGQRQFVSRRDPYLEARRLFCVQRLGRAYGLEVVAGEGHHPGAFHPPKQGPLGPESLRSCMGAVDPSVPCIRAKDL